MSWGGSQTDVFSVFDAILPMTEQMQWVSGTFVLKTIHSQDISFPR